MGAEPTGPDGPKVKFQDGEGPEEYLQEIDCGENGKFWAREQSQGEAVGQAEEWQALLKAAGGQQGDHVEEIAARLPDDKLAEFTESLKAHNAKWGLIRYLKRWSSDRPITLENCAVLPRKVSRHLWVRITGKGDAIEGFS